MLLKAVMIKQVLFTTTTLTLLALLSTNAKAVDLTTEFDEKHKQCLESIAEDSELALEEAMIWRSEGGGRRAKHCEAMALFALGHEDEAAHRLDTLAQASDGGSPNMRANFYAEAANFWLASENAEKAYSSATAGLDIQKDHIDLRIARARSYAMAGRYDYAEIDLSSVLVSSDENRASHPDMSLNAYFVVLRTALHPLDEWNVGTRHYHLPYHV